jgi:XTP/dITP diphosphohydrolase
MNKKLEATQRLLEVMDRLRSECPWDREQTFASLRKNTIEETFELCDAITAESMDDIKEELGDLLLHIVFYAKMADEQNAFDYADVCNALCDKLIYRHPHVYGDVHADNPEEVIHNWEMLKLKEKAKKARKEAGGVLSGVPRSLPAMVKAFRIGQKAASAGFDWEQKEDVWAKVHEEVAEVEAEVKAGNKEALEGEIGDLLFSIINASRLYGIDPENALERTNKKFMARFSHIEQGAAAQGRSLGDMTLDEMESLWQEAKELR